MNQRADSWKKNLQLNRAKALIDRQGWLLSHTMRCGMAKNRIEPAPEGVDERFSWTFPGRLMRSASLAPHHVRAGKCRRRANKSSPTARKAAFKTGENVVWSHPNTAANTTAMGRRLRAAPPSVLRNREARTA
jgi:hypothetical protein